MRGKCILSILLLFTAWPEVSRAATWTVNPGESIQAAIDAANDTDQIEVAPGTYYETVDFKGKAVRLYSAGGQEATIIDGQNARRGVQCISGEDPNTVLEGFTIRNCRANQGAGMYNENSSPTITECIFLNNTAGAGGGIYNLNSDPALTFCSFTSNTTFEGIDGADGRSSGGNGTVGGDGAGMYNNQSDATVTDCRFDLNITGMGGSGGNTEIGSQGGYGADGGCGGGACNLDCSPVFLRCVFTGNQTGRGARGGYGSSIRSSGNGGNGAGMYSRNTSPQILDCDFVQNLTGIGGISARHSGDGGDAGSGGGIYSVNSSPTMTGCRFIENQTGKGGLAYRDSGGSGGISGRGGHGAGMFSNNSLATLTRCTFSGNITGDGGRANSAHFSYDAMITLDGASGGDGGSGAGICGIGGNLDLIACVFNANRTGSGASGGNGGDGIVIGGDGGDGGNGGLGACIYSSSNCVIVANNCMFSGNTAGGGGIRGVRGCGISCGSNGISGVAGTSGLVTNSSSASLMSCTFRENSGAGIISNISGDVSITNCILWDTGSPEIVHSGTVTVTYSDVRDGTGNSWFGLGCIEADPLFADAEGRIPPYSPCAGAGDNDANGLSLTDLDGNPRIIGSRVDMGVYECTTLAIQNITDGRNYEKIQAAIDEANPGDQICVMPGHYQETIDFKGKPVRLFSLDGPESTTIDGTGAYHVVKCVSGEGLDTILDGFTITGGKADGGLNDDFNDGNHNGWMVVDQGNLHGPSAWSAASGQMVQSSNIHTYPYDTTVQRGTFAVWRFGADWKDYTVEAKVFSADDDAIGLMFRYQDEQNYYRFSWGGSQYRYMTLGKMVNNSWTILSQLPVSGTYPHDWCTVMIRARGSQLYVYLNGESNLVLSADDSALESGSIALYNWGNQGAYYDDVIVKISDSDTWDTIGGGMYNLSSNPTVTHCIFRNNWALEGGGAMANLYAGSLTVSNCVFRLNSSVARGGAVLNSGCSDVILTNCTFNANTSEWLGAAMHNYSDCPATVTNCILWGNTGHVYNPEDDEIYGTSHLAISHSIVEGAAGQSWFRETDGNFDTDPMFADAPAGNLKLLASSVCLDTGTNLAPGLPLTDIDGHPRIIDGDGFPFPQADRGAYEFNYADRGDFNYDCRVDWEDLSMLAEFWLSRFGEPGWDKVYDISAPSDNLINLHDMAVLGESWQQWLAAP